MLRIPSGKTIMLNHFGRNAILCLALSGMTSCYGGQLKRSSSQAFACREFGAEIIQVASLMRYAKQHGILDKLDFDSRNPPQWLKNVANGTSVKGYRQLDRATLQRALSSHNWIVYARQRQYQGVPVVGYKGPGFYGLRVPSYCQTLGVADDGGLVSRKPGWLGGQ